MTLPEGRAAVERQTVSGWWTFWIWAVENQVLNWVKGERERSARVRVPFVYWSACWVSLLLAGATGRMLEDAWKGRVEGPRGGGGWRATDQLGGGVGGHAGVLQEAVCGVSHG